MTSVIVAGGDVRTDCIGHIINGHGLKPHTAGASQNGIEDSFTAKEDILHSGNLLNIHLNTGRKSCNITGIHNQLLTGLQLILVDQS